MRSLLFADTEDKKRKGQKYHADKYSVRTLIYGHYHRCYQAEGRKEIRRADTSVFFGKINQSEAGHSHRQTEDLAEIVGNHIIIPGLHSEGISGKRKNRNRHKTNGGSVEHALLNPVPVLSGKRNKTHHDKVHVTNRHHASVPVHQRKGSHYAKKRKCPRNKLVVRPWIFLYGQIRDKHHDHPPDDQFRNNR